MDEMKEVFLELHKEWFANKQFWFDKNPEYDAYLSQKYFTKIENIDSNDLDLDNCSYETIIGAIVAFDQIPRHHNRISSVDCNKYSKIASDISSTFFGLVFLDRQNKDMNQYKNISAYEWCFILLPFRHLRIKPLINLSIDEMMVKYNDSNTSVADKQIYKNFIKNAINDVYKMNTEEYISYQVLNQNRCVDGLDKWDIYKNILYHCPKDDVVDIDKFKQYAIVRQFTESAKKLSDNTDVIVSLSGGVDSCVSLYLMKKLIPNKNIIAVHINYNNRDECDDEVKFIQCFCSVIDVKLYYRTITELKREDCHFNGLRDLYEVATKDIRFDMYEQVTRMFPNRDAEVVVLLGHNKDDCFENIVTNISMKNNYSNLSGTEEFATISGIRFWRPLLNVMKCDIIDFAHTVNIPYLQDSTPSWSARGKIRDTIYPALKLINPDIMGSYFALKDQMTASDELINSMILPIMMKKFNCTKGKIDGVFELSEIACYHIIWSKIFASNEFNGIMDNRTNSFKSIEQFVEMLRRFKISFEKMREKNVFNVITKFVLRRDIDVRISRTRDDKVMITFVKNDE
jgi:tRNA(Ile)-lysidine synthetase-like protein